MTKSTVYDLPAGMKSTDCDYPSWKSKVKMAKQADGYTTEQFELWMVANGTGWCIPTLDIGNAGRHATRRTYAVRVSDGSLMSIGRGPHVLTTTTVYVKASRVKALQKYLDIRNKGLLSAHQCRDRISTRRARTAANRSMMGF